jgi:hypothetical protein
MTRSFLLMKEDGSHHAFVSSNYFVKVHKRVAHE